MKAAENGKKDAIKILLIYGCDISSKNKVLCPFIQYNKSARDLFRDESMREEFDKLKERIEEKLLILYLHENHNPPFNKIPATGIKQLCDYV